MWYALEQDRNGNHYIMMNTLEGRVKLENMRADPRVSLCVVNTYHFVTITGTVKIIENKDTAQKGLHALAIRYVEEQEANRQMKEVT